MNRIRTFAPIMFVALSLAAGPAFAAQRGPSDRGSQDRDSRGRGNGNDRGAGRGGGRTEAPREPEARRGPTPGVGVAVPRSAPREPEARRGPTPGVGVAVPRSAPRVIEPRRPAPRESAPRTVAPSARRAFAPRTIAPRIYVRPRPLYRPYYTFHPRFDLGFRLLIGYPVAYPYYYYPYAYPVLVPVPGPTGGLSFDITPGTAEVFVDGRYVGLVEDFSSTMQPLSLVPGRHRIEIHEEGFEPLVFDADVLAGQVIPFQGAMEQQ